MGRIFIWSYLRHELEALGSDIKDGNQKVELVDVAGHCFERTVKVDTVLTYDCIA